MTVDAETFYPVVRGLFFYALLLLLGTQTAGWIAGRRLEQHHNGPATRVRGILHRWATPLAVLLLVLCLARAALQLWSLKDPDDTLTWDFTKAVLLDGIWGSSWLLQSVVALLLLILALVPQRTARYTAGVRPVLIALALWAQTGMGHAVSSFWGGSLGRVLQLSHLVGGGIWLGTLALLAMVVFPLLQDEAELPTLAGVLADFSLLARIGAALVVGSGTLIALKYAGSLHAFLGATWGRLLLLKISGLVGVAGLGWYNWRIVTPTIARGDQAGVAQLRRAVRLELALGLAMLAITAFLVATQLPREG